MKRVGVLGNGVTASAIRAFLESANGHEEVPINDAEIIVTSPGIPPRDWPETSVEIISDIEFAYRIITAGNHAPTIIGITGTNGKTTVTAGIAHALGVTPYGNIGTPLISQLDEALMHDVIVLELSSYQLQSSPTLHCDVAIIMNIEPDHLDWHESFENYMVAKKSLLKPTNQIRVLPSVLATEFQIEDAVIIDALPVPGWPQFLGHHNEKNAAIIQDVLYRLGKTADNIANVMAKFQLPPFRCESIYSKGALTIINDSKATNMAATMAAVNSFEGRKLLILCGEPKEGYSKEWIAGILNACDIVYAAGFLSQNQHVFPADAINKITFFDNLRLATQAAITEFNEGTILLSPSGASFDEFKNYLDRGEAFNDYVKDAL